MKRQFTDSSCQILNTTEVPLVAVLPSGEISFHGQVIGLDLTLHPMGSCMKMLPPLRRRSNTVLGVFEAASSTASAFKSGTF